MQRSSVFVKRHLLLTAALYACAPGTDPHAPIGEPLPGLTAAELARFRAGDAAFGRVYSPDEGLGPLFNENQCSACHTSPASGGTGDQLLVRGSRFTPPDRCDLLSPEGGENVRTQATPLLQAHGIERQPFPASATERSAFTPPFLFGLGLIEQIDESEILQRSRTPAGPDGVTGRPGRNAHGRFARFGRKAEFASIEDFTHNALHLEMGLTTSRHPDEGSMAGVPFPPDVDPATDPEVGDEVVALLADFVRFLAPPERGAPLDAADARTIERGELIFERIGCAACHTPSMTTSRASSRALSRQRVFLYSDLLLHDMGPELAGVCGVAATTTELRTAPLMGLRHRRQLLHDGRAHDPFEAIRFHGGQAAPARARFDQLPELDRHAVVRFLGSL